MPNRVGRPREISRRVEVHRPDGTVITQTRAEIILEHLRRGVSVSLSARLAGTEEATVGEWVRRGEDRDASRETDEEYAGFAAAFRDARAQGEAIYQRSVTLASVPRQVTTVKESTRQVLGDDGQVRTLTDRSVTTREEFDWRAAVTAGKLQYGWREAPSGVQVELSGPDGGPMQAEILAGQLRAFLDGRDAGLSESDVVDVAALPDGDG